jgi:cobaltochelatase CobT
MNHLTKVFPIYAQIISGQVGIKVEIGGNQAYCDGKNKVIHLPALPLDKPELAESAWGYQYHEAFHAKHSNFDLLETVAGQPLRKSMLNIIEDIWDEATQPKEFYTSKVAIDAMNLKIFNEGGFESSKSKDKPAAILSNYVLLQGIAYFNNLPELQPIADQTEKVLREVFSIGVVTRLNALLDDGISRIESTEDSLALTDQILKMLQEEDDKENKPDQSDNKDENQSSNDQDDQDQNDDPSKSNSDSKNQGDQNDSNSDSQDDEDSSAKLDSPDQPGQSNNNDTTGKKPKQSVIQETLNAVEGDLPKDKLETIKAALSQAATGNYKVAKPAPLSAFKKGNRSKQVYDNASSASSGARKQLQRIIQSAYRNNPKVRSFGNRMDQNRMHRAIFADPNVFIHKGHKLKKDTAFHILLDASPSMSHRLSVALEATMALGLALERIPGINLAISRFPIDGINGGLQYDDDVQPMIRHGDRIVNNLDRFNIGTMGGTPMANSMWYSYGQLIQQKSPRKILFIISDGQPNNRVSVVEAYQWAQSVGVETVGLGINTDAMKSLFTISDQINNINELETALFSMTRNLLTLAA